MEYCTLKGLMLVLLIQHCRCEGPSTAIHSSVVTHHEGQILSQEPALPPAEAAPVVSPPSLKEVQQAVQEASEQVEGRGAEEVLKELLERVVEAALGQVEAGSEAKGDVAAEQEVDEEDVLGAEAGEREAATEADELQQTVEDESTGTKGEGTDAEEKQEVEEGALLEDVGGEANEAVEGGDGTIAVSAEETTADAETGVEEVEDEGVIYEPVRPELSQEVVEGAVAASEETGMGKPSEEALQEDTKEQVVMLEEKDTIETEIQGEVETPAVLEVPAGGQLETLEESETNQGEDDVEQIEHDLGKDGEKPEVAEVEGEEITLFSDNSELENAETGVGTAVEERDEENLVTDAEKTATENEQVSLVDVGIADEVEAEASDIEEATEGEKNLDDVMKEQSVSLLNGKGDQPAGEDLQTTLETSYGIEKDDQEMLVISGPEPEDSAEASMEQSPENQAPTPNPSSAEVETGENPLAGEEIITPTDDLLPHDPEVAQPTLDNSVKEAQAEAPQAEGDEPGEVNELVEDTPETAEANELSLEAWKIGAISAAVFLVLETVIIIIYVFKRRNKNSTTALQRACEDGCVEPEAATGGDCSDDTLPAGNGDTQQISILDASDVASTLAKKKASQEDRATVMSELPPSSTEESASTGLGPDSSQDLRTSIL